MISFTIRLDRNSASPVYEQIYRFVSCEIRAGRLSENERLPSKKALAAHLGISPNTVESAYAMLCQEGYVYSRPRSGYYVSHLDAAFSSGAESSSSEAAADQTYRYDFMTNTVDSASFPFRTWAKLGKEVLYNGEPLLTSGSCCGDKALIESLCKYLREFRAVCCSPSQIIVGAGMEYLLMLLCRLLPDTASFAVEDPGYVKTPYILSGCGKRISYIPLDAEGMSISELSLSEASVACITPSHQFPTGIVMPIGRRMELLKWASESPERYIIEDDYNSEFNFIGRPIPSLQGMDNRRVIYISTFSRVLAPSIRIAYMVLPPELVEASSSILKNYSATVSRFEQNTLAAFISGGFLERHLNRMKTLYRRRRDCLLEAITPYAKQLNLTVSGTGAGLHLLISGSPDIINRILKKAETENIRVLKMSSYYHCYTQPETTLLLGYAGMNNEELIAAVKLLFGAP